MHPRLLAGIILIDPVIDAGPTAEERGLEAPMEFSIAAASTYRRDLWPSREAAAEAFRKNPFYQRWDKRVLDLWLEHGLRALPTLLYPIVTTPCQAEMPVTLTTTKHQEVSWSLGRDPHVRTRI